MTQTLDSLTLALTGQLPFILITAGILAFPLSLLLLRLYRRAVLRSMALQAGAPHPAGIAPELATAQPPAPLKTLSLPEADPTPLSPGAQALYRRAVDAPWRASAVYGLGGVVFAGIMAAAFLAAARIPFQSMRFLMLTWTFGWPLLLTLVLVAGATTRRKLWLSLAYFAGYVSLGSLSLALFHEFSLQDLVNLWWTQNLIPTALVLAYLSRRVRGVGPLVLTFLVLGLTGSVALVEILRRNESLLRAVSGVGFSLGLGASSVLVVLHLVGFAALGVLGWLMVQRIRAGYEGKKISDQSLTLDSLWLLFGLVYSISLSFGGAGFIFSGLVAFGVYKALTTFGFTAAGSLAAGHGVRLLLLRVFALGKRSETLFDELGTSWRYVGSTQLIAGPDLATITVAPHEFLQFLTGTLARRFIGGPDTLERRLAEMDLSPDRDWRYRVNDFFCYADTWQLVLTRLVLESDTVLMDLRSFSRERAGCIFEITEIINHVPLDRTVFIVDATTDGPFLHQVVTQAWHNLRPSSPNYGNPSPQLRLFNYTDSESRLQLLRVVCAAASPIQ